MLQKRTRKELNTNQQSKSSIKVRKYWSEEEDQILREAVKLHGSDWKLIAQFLNGRNASQCAQRWKRVKPDNEERNQKWTEQEDLQVRKLTKDFKFEWKQIAKLIPTRSSRQIRERYINHLDPGISTKAWTQQEDLKIWTLYQKIGSRWSEMAKKLKGRPENMIKNRYYGYIRKTYAKQENPYYIVPVQKRKLNEGGENNEVTNNKQGFAEESFEPLIDNSLKKVQQQNLNQQQAEINPFEINSIFYSNDAFNRSTNSNLQEIHQFHSFQKIFNNSIENEIMRFEPHFVNFESQEEIIQNQNEISFSPLKQFKDQVNENDNFINQFLSNDCQAKALKIRDDIFEELTKNSINDLMEF